MYRLRMALLGVLSPDKAAQGEDRAVLIYENDHGRYMTYAVPDGGLGRAGENAGYPAQPEARLPLRKPVLVYGNPLVRRV